MTTLIYILVGIVALIVILGVIAPKTYDVSRSIVIKKPLADVYNYLKFIKNQDQWSPWAEKDPDMKKTFTGTDGKVGFISAWVGNKDVGSGEQELTGFIENKEVASQLRFLKPWKSTSDAYLRIEETEGGTKVIWGFSGANKFPISIMMLFMNMEEMLGPQLEKGLTTLKDVLEK